MVVIGNLAVRRSAHHWCFRRRETDGRVVSWSVPVRGWVDNRLSVRRAAYDWCFEWEETHGRELAPWQWRWVEAYYRAHRSWPWAMEIPSEPTCDSPTETPVSGGNNQHLSGRINERLVHRLVDEDSRLRRAVRDEGIMYLSSARESVYPSERRRRERRYE